LRAVGGEEAGDYIFFHGAGQDGMRAHLAALALRPGAGAERPRTIFIASASVKLSSVIGCCFMGAIGCLSPY
jgi:hypothetical protein